MWTYIWCELIASKIASPVDEHHWPIPKKRLVIVHKAAALFIFLWINLKILESQCLQWSYGHHSIADEAADASAISWIGWRAWRQAATSKGCNSAPSNIRFNPGKTTSLLPVSSVSDFASCKDGCSSEVGLLAASLSSGASAYDLYKFGT